MSDNRDNYWEDEDEDDTPTGAFESDTDLVKKLRRLSRLNSVRTRT
jgi:hypothetical protein